MSSGDASCGLRSCAQPYRVFDDSNVFLHILCALGCVLDLLEDLHLPHRGLTQDLADERNGRRQVLLYCIPWHLILSSLSTACNMLHASLRYVACSLMCSWADVYLRPSRRHYYRNTRSGRVSRNNCLFSHRFTVDSAQIYAFSKMCSELVVVFFPKKGNVVLLVKVSGVI